MPDAQYLVYSFTLPYLWWRSQCGIPDYHHKRRVGHVDVAETGLQPTPGFKIFRKIIMYGLFASGSQILPGRDCGLVMTILFTNVLWLPVKSGMPHFQLMEVIDVQAKTSYLKP
jgi:hypothetical protein